jgi:hypothetical protein
LNTYEKRKWGPKYKGPYLVKKIIGPVVLLLQNCETRKEDLVHTSYIRPYHSRSKSPLLELQSDDEELHIEPEEQSSQKPNYLELEQPLHSTPDNDNEKVEDNDNDEFSDTLSEGAEEVVTAQPSLMQSFRNIFSNSPDPLEREIRRMGDLHDAEQRAQAQTQESEQRAPTPERRRRVPLKPPGFYKETRAYTKRAGD